MISAQKNSDFKNILFILPDDNFKLLNICQWYEHINIEIIPNDNEQTHILRDLISNGVINNLTILEKNYIITKNYDFIYIHDLNQARYHLGFQMLELLISSINEKGILLMNHLTRPEPDKLVRMRDLVNLHTKDETDEGTKIARAREIIEFLSRADDHNNHKTIWPECHKILNDWSNEKAFAFLFWKGYNCNAFIEEVNQLAMLGFHYCANLDFKRMLNQDLPHNTQAFLKNSTNLLVNEQYIDTILELPARESIFIRSTNNINIDHRIEPERLMEYAIISRMKIPLELKDLLNNEPLSLMVSENTSITIDDVLVKIAFKILSEAYPSKLDIKYLTKSCVEYAKQSSVLINEDIGAVQAYLTSQILILYLGLTPGIIELLDHNTPIDIRNTFNYKPRVSRLNRYLVKTFGKVISIDSKFIGLDDVGIYICSSLNGEYTIDEVTSALLRHLQNDTELCKMVLKDSEQGNMLYETSILVQKTLGYLVNYGILLN